MSDLRKAAEMALEALEWALYHNKVWKCAAALEALRPALAQPEPVMFNGLTEAETNASASVMGLTPPQRNALPLSDDEIKCIKPICADFVSFRAGVRHAEREHGIE